jgi:hypothetical protein
MTRGLKNAFLGPIRREKSLTLRPKGRVIKIGTEIVRRGT